MSGTRAWIGVVCGAAALLIWAAWFAVTRQSVTHVLRPPDIVVLRLGVGSLVLLPFFVRDGRIPGRAWFESALLSLCWGAPFVLLVALGIRLTSAAHAAALTPGTMPVFAGVIAWLWYGARPRPRQLIGYGVIVAGVAVMAAATLRGGTGWHEEATGDAALLAGALGWALYTVRFGRSGLSTVQASFLVCAWSLVAFLPIYLLAGLSRFPQASAGEFLWQLFYQGLLSGGIAVIGYNEAVRRLGPNAAAVIGALVPVGAALLAIPIIGEVPAASQWGAIVAISAGVFLVAFAVRRRVAAAGMTGRPEILVSHFATDASRTPSLRDAAGGEARQGTRTSLTPGLPRR
jgi:drug/metabolite transporter (DMT)-like permease